MNYVDCVRNADGTPLVGRTLKEAQEYCAAHGGRLPYMWEAYAFRSMESNDAPDLNEWVVPNVGQDENVRGGCWGYYSSLLRAAGRKKYNPEYRYSSIGFRCVLNA